MLVVVLAIIGGCAMGAVIYLGHDQDEGSDDWEEMAEILTKDGMQVRYLSAPDTVSTFYLYPEGSSKQPYWTISGYDWATSNITAVSIEGDNMRIARLDDMLEPTGSYNGSNPCQRVVGRMETQVTYIQLDKVISVRYIEHIDGRSVTVEKMM